MRIKLTLVAAVSSLGLLASAAPAMAGNCDSGATNCNVGVNVIAPAPAQFGPMTVRTQHPMGHLRHVDFQRAPNVSITRVHGMGPTAGLSDAPSGFTGGCYPTSTQYCRTDMGTPVTIDMAPTPAPVVAAPYVAPAPVVAAPVYTAPAQPVWTGRTFTGQGYDPSKFQPRQYGDNTFTPGIAHVPTSYVDRSPANAQAALNSGRAVTQPLANGGMTPAIGLPGPSIGMGSVGYSAPAPAMGGVTLPGTYSQRVTLPGTYAAAPAMGAVTLPDTYMAAPAMGMGGQATAPVLTQNGTYASNVGADGTYWEKTSGPTMFGNTMATQVICKRKLPTQVVNPVVNVPYAVPTPVPTCGPAPHAPHAGHNTRYGQHHGSRWVK